VKTAIDSFRVEIRTNLENIQERTDAQIAQEIETGMVMKQHKRRFSIIPKTLLINLSKPFATHLPFTLLKTSSLKLLEKTLLISMNFFLQRKKYRSANL